jgi:hypothetical protein
MKRIAAVMALGLLVSCGVDGEPVPPKLSAETTIGVNSETGAFNRIAFTLFFGGGA